MGMGNGDWILSAGGYDIDEPLQVINALLAEVRIEPYPGIVEGQLMAIGASARSGKPEQLGWLLCALVAKVIDLEERLAAIEGRGKEAA